MPQSQTKTHELECVCGKTVMVPDHIIGKTIVCPHCKQKRRVTEVCLVSTTKEGEGKDFDCECGASVYVSERHIGKTATCAQCNKRWKATEFGLVEPRGRLEATAHTNPGRIDQESTPTGAVKICSACGSMGTPTTRGSFVNELVLWIILPLFVAAFAGGTGALAALIVAAIYSAWRIIAKNQTCPACGAIALIPLDTPAGKKLRKQYGSG